MSDVCNYDTYDINYFDVCVYKRTYIHMFKCSYNQFLSADYQKRN